jgi:hypothetical protein
MLRWDDNITTNLTEKRYEDVNSVKLAQARFLWRDFVDTDELSGQQKVDRNSRCTS